MCKDCDNYIPYSPMKPTYPRYRLKKDIPGLRAGAVFELRFDVYHSGILYAQGVLVLAERLDGYPKGGYSIPYDVATSKTWFDPIPETNYLKESLLEKVEKLKEIIKSM